MSKLTYYGGNGFGGCQENDLYQVKWGEKNSKLFGKLSEARKFYDALDCEKAIWDHKRHELLDAWS